MEKNIFEIAKPKVSNMKPKNPNYKKLSKLIELVSELRKPITGCPWDIQQNHQSLTKYLIEETYEVVDAIRHEDYNNLREELGDLLLQIILHAQIASENEIFDIEDIANNINEKLIRRHPHVFEKRQALTIAEVNDQWQKIKVAEKKVSCPKSPLSNYLLNKIRSQPAMDGAMTISKKAADAGFEWETIDELWGKVYEELDELKEALAKLDKNNAEEELGDVLFTLTNIARWTGLKPEEGLAKSNKKFLKRFAFMEASLIGKIKDHSFTELKKSWEAAKSHFKKKGIKNQ